MVLQKSMQPLQVIIWSSRSIMGSHFFKNQIEATIMINGDIYCTMKAVIFFCVHCLHGIDVNDVKLQQQGATCHISNEIIYLLRQTFDSR